MSIKMVEKKWKEKKEINEVIKRGQRIINTWNVGLGDKRLAFG